MAVAARSGAAFRTGPLGLLGDERLARLAASGHERAFAVVYERHQQALYRYCRSILRNDADAQDALQSTFTAAFAALGRGRPDAPIRPWLFRIAHNEAVSALRRRRSTTELSAATDYGTTSVEDQVAERAELDLLLRDLRELHERQRSALVMRELSGLSHDEIALALQTSVGAAKQAIYEARRSLFEFAEGRAMPCADIQRTISDADGRLLRSRRVRAHLRDCSACAGFAAAIPARRQELRALVPSLPAVTAAGLLERLAGTGAGAGAGHGAGVGLGGLVTGAAGKAAGGALAANALAGAAVVATATVGVTIGVDKLAQVTSEVHTAAPGIAHISAGHRGSGRTDLLPAVQALGHGQGVTGGLVSGASAAHRPTAAGAGEPASGFMTGVKAGSGSATTSGHGHAYGATKTHPGHGPPPWAGSGAGHGSGATGASNSTGVSSSTGQGARNTRTHAGSGPSPRAGSGAGHGSSATGASSSTRQAAGTTKSDTSHGTLSRATTSRRSVSAVKTGTDAAPIVTTPAATPSAPPGAAVSAAHKTSSH